MIWAALYITAIVAANYGVSLFGPWSAPIIAFLLIGAVLTLRDKLHDLYGPRTVMWLILLGTVISVLFGGSMARIALAGALAFTVSELADTGVYHVLRKQPWLRRVNVSNTAGAAVDSILFPSLAFGGFPVAIVLLQFAAKTAGGALWALLLDKHTKIGLQ
jgi:uncharacterized PurR-regulated membrane protein YhhQ (DUF165 family)